MRLARVEGSIWAIQKEKGMENIKLLIVQLINVRKQPEWKAIIAMDRIGAGFGELVIIPQGSPAQRLT
ncbi:EutN/CcmL family microcompartment protein [Bacillus sp. MUM 116]|uniref:EutN/CcmL family microcompartment protein n=1 Tax=Bacillus sp. MUM 116 TaxID=1678002 RepID=UPI0009F3ED6B